MNNYKHTTVLLNESINALNIHPNGIYIDGTFGCGGHSKSILSKLGAKGRLIAFDRDPQAVSIAKNINDPRFSIAHHSFSTQNKYIAQHKLTGKINGIILDLGCSSLQIENAERGFSFMRDGPLDMRMDQTSGQSASDWLKCANEVNISWIIKTFGEEKFNKKIARAIVKYKSTKSIVSTKELAKVIAVSIPRSSRYKHKHPATRSFQAIRIWINNELEEIKIILEESINMLAPSGRLVVISFHSLEDRIVKNFMRRYSCNQQIPSKLPISETQLRKLKKQQLKILGKLMPNKKELIKNPRSRSAILRIAERTSI